MKRLLYGVWTYQENTMCVLTMSRKGLLYGVWTYLGKVLSTVCGLTQGGYFVQCVWTISEGHFGGIGLIWQCIYTVYGAT